ncbi:MAG: 1,4-alpha-glucan branching protein domain-containing protein [Opitutales bacterium]
MKQPRILSVFLHAHLPYGFPADRQISLEQAWLYEAVTNCYLPLLRLIERLEHREQPWLTFSLSPTLLEQWSHPEFPGSYRKHIRQGLRIIDSEVSNPRHPLERRKLALKLLAEWELAAKHFEKIDGQLSTAFKYLEKNGKIEIVTTAATHAFLPAFQNDSSFRCFQIENGLRTLERHTGLNPTGFWLPECAYFDGLENDLARFGIEYFALEEQGLTRASPPASIRKPMACPNGLLALGRDSKLSQKIWSARTGYPGHPCYREFHHDGIHLVDTARCGEYALPDGGRLPLGLKYWRITGKAKKDWYQHALAEQQAELDADDFLKHLQQTEEGLVFIPFDAELFGHWWYEGPAWLEKVLTLASESPGTEVLSAKNAAAAFDDPPTGRPAPSTWGRNSDYSFWVNYDTDWIYPLLRRSSNELKQLVGRYSLRKASSIEARAIRQAGRELLLASASDWPFMLRAGATGQYAMEQLREHVENFHYLTQSIESKTLSERELELLEKLDPAFTEIALDSFLGVV